MHGDICHLVPVIAGFLGPAYNKVERQLWQSMSLFHAILKSKYIRKCLGIDFTTTFVEPRFNNKDYQSDACKV
jgi:hypothetical protein